MDAIEKGVTYFPKQGAYHGDTHGSLPFTDGYDSPVIGRDRANLVRDSEAQPISSCIDFESADPVYRILSNFVAPINNDKYCSLDRVYYKSHLDKSDMRQNHLHVSPIGSENIDPIEPAREIQLTLLDHPIETLHSGSERYSYQDMVIQAQTIRYNRNKRERRALECLKDLKYHYTKDKTGMGAFSSIPRPDNVRNLSYRDSRSPDDPHRSMIDEIQGMCEKFYDLYGIRLTHFVTNLKMMHALALDAFPSDTHNLEPYQKCMGLKKFPGMPDARLIASPYCDDYKLYAVSWRYNPMRLIEGPKRVKTWIGPDDAEHIQMLDYCQYSCLQGRPDGRLYGCIAAFDSGEMK